MQLFVSGVLTASSYVALSLGFALIFQTTKIFHFAYGALYAVAGYVAFGIAANSALPFFVAAAIGIVVAAAVGTALHLLIYEPLLARRGSFLSLFVTSLGAFVLLRQVLALSFGQDIKMLPSALDAGAPLRIAGASVTQARLLVFAVQVAAIVMVLVLLKRSELGLLICAVSAESDLAETLGRNLRRIRASVFAVGTALSGIAAVGKLAVVGVVSQSGSLEAALIGSVAMFVGGAGSIAGAVLGGIVLATMQTLAAGYISGTWSDVIVYGMLLAVILLRPAGLLGSRRIGSLD